MNDLDINKWHDEENTWWNKFSDIMAYQWKLNDNINSVIRKNMEESYQNYLFKENGNIIDIGCGTGWLALYFAKKGMDSVGVDFSEEQIKQANFSKKEENLNNLEFICTDFLKFDTNSHINKYDSIFVNAFLHHLPFSELEQVFHIISMISKKGAKIYMYEPIMFKHEKNNSFGSFILKVYGKALSLIINKIPNTFNFWRDDFRKSLNEGYNGMSPNEGSLEYSELLAILNNNSLEVTNITPEHYLSISYSIITHSMKPPYNKIYQFFVPIIYFFDKVIFKLFNWKAIAKRRSFVLCSLQLKQK